MGLRRAGVYRLLTMISTLLATLLAATTVPAADSASSDRGSGGSNVLTAPLQPSGEDRLSSSYHQLGPNDFLRVNFNDGREQNTWEIRVDGKGEVNLPFVGNVPVGGLLPSEAAEMLTEKYSRYYKQPSLSVVVLEFGQFDIFLAGSDLAGLDLKVANGTTLYQVLQENLYTIPRTADPALIKPLATPGEYRRIQLVRGADPLAGGSAPGPLNTDSTAAPAEEATGSGLLLSTPPPAAVSRSANFSGLPAYTGWSPWVEACLSNPSCSVSTFDPLQAAREGNLAALDVPLQPNDVIYIPSPQRSVQVYGLAQPGRYELLDEENLADVLRLAGTADLQSDLCNAVIERIDDCCSQGQIFVDLAAGMHDISILADFKVEDGDTIRISPRERRIFVMGEVNEAGAFDYNYDDIVTDYLALAQGMTDDANTGWLAIIRQNRDKRYPLEPADVIQVNFKEIHKGHQLPDDYRLLPGDTIYVPPKGAQFNFQQVISSLTSGFAIFQLFDNNSSGNNSSGSTGGTKTTSH